MASEFMRQKARQTAAEQGCCVQPAKQSRRPAKSGARPPVLIITGYGVNCEAESKFAWETAGADARLIHLNDLLDDPPRLREFKALMFIGGFSFGDHMGSGLVMALRLRRRLGGEMNSFIARGNLILGVCNGFQVMVKLGLLPALDGDYTRQSVTLTHNDCGFFQNFWVTIGFERQSPCVFTRGLELLDLPVRHGEGKLFTPDKALLNRIELAHCVACRYVEGSTCKPTMRFPANPNGSLNAIAGLCDPTGRVFGLMPHPEAYLFPENHPQWPRQRLDNSLPAHGRGLDIFLNAVRYLRGI